MPPRIPRTSIDDNRRRWTFTDCSGPAVPFLFIVPWRTALTTLFIERRLPWRVEQWLSDLAAVRAYREQRLERWDRALYRPYIRPGDVVFDVGANRGDKTAIFLEYGAHVIAVEPDPRTAAELRARFAGELRLEVVEAGIGAEQGEIEFHLSPHTTRSTFVVDRMRQLGDDVEYGPGPIVPLTTLDALIAFHGMPRFCKIDVEGYEPEVFRGLTQPLPALSFEFHGELLADAQECLERLTHLGMPRFNLVLHPIAGQRHQTLDHLYLPHHVPQDVIVSTLGNLGAKSQIAGDIWAFSF